MTASPSDIARGLRSPLWSARPQGLIWPRQEWQWLVDAGVPGWSIPAPFGGSGQSPQDLLDGCRELARANLSVTFILSQFQAACQRLVACRNANLQFRWLPRLASGEAFATVGISHLTTSRQHVAAPAVTAEATDGGYVLDGVVPWVTGADVADVIVLGGTLSEGLQVLTAVPRDRIGLVVEPPVELLALSESRTASVQLRHVTVVADEVLAGPAPQVLTELSRQGGGAGSLTTSALALGHAQQSLDRLEEEAAARPILQPVLAAFNEEVARLAADLRSAAQGDQLGHLTPDHLRTRATSLALRTSQAYLAAAKGAGFVTGHSAERLVREAMFFLVWSCPQVVANNLLGEFSRCDEL